MAMLPHSAQLRALPDVHPIPNGYSIDIPITGHEYRVLIARNLLPSAGPELAALCRGRDVAIITDSNVGSLYGKTVLDSLLHQKFRAQLFEVAAGEKSKCFAAAERLCTELSQFGIRRDGIVIGLGGGVIGDLAGFVAAIYLRGLDFVQMPTTLLSCVDSAVGGKTGINLSTGKNLVGAFHQPKIVLADVDTLRSLGEREFNEGMAEVIKHAIIADAKLFEQLFEPPSDETLPELLARNVEIKGSVVVADEKETSGLRALLNFGHTIGHGIEAAAGYGQYLHGEAISLGLRAAAWLSTRKAKLPEADYHRICQVLDQYELPLVLPHSIDHHPILEAMTQDKKFTGSGIRFVLSDAIGSAFVSDQVTLEDVEAAIEQLRSRAPLAD